MASEEVENKEWLSQSEIAQILGIELRKLYPRINALRGVGVIQWKIDPRDQRAILVHRSSVDTIKKSMRLDG